MRRTYPTPTEVETVQWPVADIPADDEAHMIPNPSQYLSTDIGLTDLYVINSSSVPYVFTVLLFDPRNVKDGSAKDMSPFLRSKLKGVMALQTVEDRFTPVKPILVPDDPKALIDPKNFRATAYGIGGALLESRRWPPNFTGFIKKPANTDKLLRLY